ncbi:hypothetical protein T07_3389 [Trichinella nelsoni]|uniref:Uncharacterized protein n=1 Tax=Trichinella nelsoni TaxID=6336 RepID=A0A0V0SAG1_9BILA|nr:hypothetical protein T07_3389 [Trichinella nelsoni]
MYDSGAEFGIFGLIATICLASGHVPIKLFRIDQLLHCTQVLALYSAVLYLLYVEATWRPGRVFFTLPTSLRRQGGIFRCPKITVGKPVSISLLEQSRFQPDRPTVFISFILAAMIACRYVRWLINLLPLQLPRASKRSVKRLIQPFRQYPLQEMFEGRFVAVAAGVVAIVVGFQGKSKRKKQQYPSVFEILRFCPLFNIAVAGEEEHGIFTATSK